MAPLTPELEQLAMLASTASDTKVPETSSAVEVSTSSGGVGGAKAAHHVQAFSGRGHTLSSGPSSLVGADPVMRTAKLVAEKRLVDLREKESTLQNEVTMLHWWEVVLFQ